MDSFELTYEPSQCVVQLTSHLIEPYMKQWRIACEWPLVGAVLRDRVHAVQAGYLVFGEKLKAKLEIILKDSASPPKINVTKTCKEPLEYTVTVIKEKANG